MRRANKSVPSEKLPESGQLPSNLPPGHQSISLLCPPNPWLPPFQWDPQAPQHPPNPKVKLGIGFVRQMFNATFSMTNDTVRAPLLEAFLTSKIVILNYFY